jgi:lipopolysaccharide heptosyltransferase II
MIRTPRQRLRLVLLRAFARLVPTSGSPSTALDPLETRSPRPARLLVVRPDHLGDLLFTTPALRALRQRHPDAHITALVGPWGAAVLSNNPHVDQVTRLPFPGFSRQPKTSLWQPYGLLRNWARRLRGRYDVAYILRFDHWWGALLTYLAAVPQRVGHAVPEVAPFLNRSIAYTPGRHEVEQNLNLINWDSLDKQAFTQVPPTTLPQHHPLEFHVSEPAAVWARDLLGDACPIVIHPGAGAPVKLWRSERWAAVAEALTRETGAQILLTGSPAERSLCLEIATHMESEARVMAGETTLDQLAAILNQSRLVLGLDSGPLHLAVAVGAPTVHLYGPVNPEIFGPWGSPERHRVIVSAWPCVPCNRLDYGPDELAHHPCVREIDVNPVLKAAREVLAA